jgi:hypothetical protein
MPGHLSDSWLLYSEPGDCQTHAELMAAALNVLGIKADGTGVNRTDCRVAEVRLCEQHNEFEYHFFIEILGAHTNFEGVCRVNTSDGAAVYYDKAMGKYPSEDYQSGARVEMWRQWESYPPPNCKVIHHFTYWQNH